MIPSCMKRLVEYIQRVVFNSFCNVASINCCRFMGCKFVCNAMCHVYYTKHQEITLDHYSSTGLYSRVSNDEKRTVRMMQSHSALHPLKSFTIYFTLERHSALITNYPLTWSDIIRKISLKFVISWPS